MRRSKQKICYKISMRFSRTIPLVSVWLLACAAGQNGSPPVPAQTASPSAVAARMKAIEESMRAQDFTSSSWSRSGDLASGQTHTFKMLFSVQQRVVLAVLGDNHAVDIDLEVKDRAGGLVAADRTPNRRAVLEWVADFGESYNITLTAKRGEGRFLLRAFYAPPSVAPAQLTGFFDADLTGRRSFGAAVERMRRLGFRQSGEQDLLRAAQQERFTFPIQLVKGRCFTFVAQGSSGIDQVELRLENQHGLVAADLARRSEAWVRYCAEQDTEARLILIVRAGSGSVVLGRFVADRREVADLVGPPLRLVDSFLNYEQAQRTFDARFDRLGYCESEELVSQTNLAAGERISASFTLEPGECAAIYSVSDYGALDVDMELRPGIESTPVIDRTEKGLRFLGVCADLATANRIELIAISGEGRVSAHLRRLPSKNLPKLSNVPIQFLAAEAAAKLGLAEMSLVKPPAFMTRDPRRGGYQSSIRLRDDRCYGVAAIAPEAILRLTVHDSNEALVGVWTGPGAPALLALCPDTGQRYTIRAAIVAADGINAASPYLLVFSSEKPSGAVRGYP